MNETNKNLENASQGDISQDGVNQGVVIDNATLQDIPAMVALLAQLFSIEVDFNADSERQVQGLTLLLAATEHAVIKVARDGAGKAIGMVSAQLVISTAQGTPAAWMEDMVVSQAYRGGGIGRRLLAAASDWAKSKGATRVQLLVDTENLPAVGYYRHLGWEPTQLQARRMFI